jgi:hypothetical protein
LIVKTGVTSRTITGHVIEKKKKTPKGLFCLNRNLKRDTDLKSLAMSALQI